MDQTRGWFYSLLAIATGLEARCRATVTHQVAPYRAVVVNDSTSFTPPTFHIGTMSSPATSTRCGITPLCLIATRRKYYTRMPKSYLLCNMAQNASLVSSSEFRSKSGTQNILGIKEV